MDRKRRIVLFGGQGSQSLFSPASVSVIEEDIATSSAPLILLSKCHAAFLEELSSLNENEKNVLRLDPQRFAHAHSLISVQGEDQEHAVLQATTLCLHQLLHYLCEAERQSTTLDAYFNEILEATGFCAGLVPAAVVAASRNIANFIQFGVEAFRLAFWSAYRTMMRSLEYRGNQSLGATWSLIVSGLDQAKVEDAMRGIRAQSVSPTLRISALSYPNIISVSGCPHELAVLKNLLGPQTSFAHVHAWYHGGEQLEEVVLQIEKDITKRDICFPSASSVLKPLRSTLDASMFDPSSAADRLDIWVVRHLLTHCVHWNEVSQCILQTVHQTLQDDQHILVTIDSFGPSSQFLLAGAKASSNHSRLHLQDLSSFSSLRRSGDRGVGKEGIAVVGMGLNLPKGKGPEEMWQTLSDGLSAIQEIPDSRFNLSDLYTTDEPSKGRSMHAKHGAFLDEIWAFDNMFFSISPREAMSMDPQQRILLHTAQAALDDAGWVPDSTPSSQRSSTGCYIGLATGDYTDNLRDEIDAFYSPGTLRAFHSGRLSYVHKFSGPCMTIDTACSSSLVSIYLACQALRNGDCTSALAGGVNAICSPDMFIGLDKGHFLSSTGGCKSFDASADGYSRAEGSVVFVLKRLSDAIIENDRIHGVIKDAVVNQSGNAHSITHPHTETQVLLYEKLLLSTGVHPSSISVVEAHGTGTQAGDTREIASLENVFGRYHSEGHPLMVSSIKGNIGHCEAASGAAGLAKLLLMLRHGLIPRQAGLMHLNPKLAELEQGHLKIPKENQSWPTTKHLPRRAMLNNFGAAGSNAALLLEEHKDIQSEERNNKSYSAYPFLLSARSQDALHKSIKDYQQFLGRGSNLRLEDICYTAAARRPLYEFSVATSCSSIAELQAELDHFDASKIAQANARGRFIFVFSGQGSVYAGMAKELLQTSDVFKEHVLRCNDIVQSKGYPSILMHFDEATQPSEDTDEIIASQCACVALEYALGMLLMSWNIIPSYTMGHSLGEFAALTISGALTIQDTMRIVASRAKSMTTLCARKASGMTVCKLHWLEADAMLGDCEEFLGLRVACRNSKTDCVVSGPIDRLGVFEEACADKDIKAKRLDVPYGFHSASMDPILPSLKELGSSVKWSKPSIPVLSTVFGRLLSSDQDFGSDYLALHASQPVLFESSIEVLDSEGILEKALCMEIGPHPISLPMIRSTVTSEACCCIPTLQKGISAWKSLSAALCQMVPLTNNLDWRSVFASANARMIDLPAYPLIGREFKVQYRETARTFDDASSISSDPYTETGLRFLPRMICIEDGHLFETTTDLLESLILGHEVGGTAICPASVFLELVLEAARAVFDVSATDILVTTDMRFTNPLVYMRSENPKRVQVHLSDQSLHAVVEFRVTLIGVDQDPRESLCCSGGITMKNAGDLKSRWIKDAALVRRQIDYLSRDEFHRTSRFQKGLLYDVVFTRVVKYSKEYQGLDELSISESSLEGVGTFKVPSVSEASYSPDVFVRWCDVLLHSAGCIANLKIQQREVAICAHVESIEILYDNIDFSSTFTVYCSLVDAVKGVIIADAFAVNPHGEVVGIMRSIEFKRLGLSAFQHTLGPSPLPANAMTPTHSSAESSMSSTGINTTPVAPASPAEPSSRSIKRTLTSILCDISGSNEEDLDFNRSLEALGIDSIMQIEMMIKLRQKFPGNDLDQTELSNCKDIHALEALISSMVVNANEIESNGNATVSPQNKAFTSDVSGNGSSLTNMSYNDATAGAQINSITIHKSSSGRTPFFIFHDGSGLVKQYSGIGGLDRSLHAFFDPLFLNPKVCFSNIQEMATQYISHLSPTETPSLIVGGWSFGGIVALEAFHQLTKLGFTVKGLILIDSPLPINHTPLPEAIITHFVKNAALIEEFQQNASLLEKYTPPTIPSLGKRFKVVLLRSQDTIDTERLCGVKYDWLSLQEARDEAQEGWMKLLGVRAKVLSIRGNHFEPFSPENVADTSAQLRKACQYIDEE